MKYVEKLNGNGSYQNEMYNEAVLKKITKILDEGVGKKFLITLEEVEQLGEY